MADSSKIAKGFTLVELVIVMAITGGVALSVVPTPSAIRDYPWFQIGVLFGGVGLLAALAKFEHTYGFRRDCETYLIAACFLCVMSMCFTVERYYRSRRPDPIPEVRLSDLTHAHKYCGPGCRAMEVGR